MQVRGDPLAIGEHRRPLLLGAGLGQLEGDRGLVGEPRGHVHVVGGECGPAAVSTPCTRCEPRSGNTSTGPASMSPHAIDISPGSSWGWDTRTGSAVVNACPASDPATGTGRPHSSAALAPTARSTRSCPPAAVGSTMLTRSARASSRARSAITCSGPSCSPGCPGGSAVGEDSSRWVTAAVACSHSPRVRAA